MHTTTSGSGGTPNGLWNAPLDMANTSFSRQFNSTGTFPYYCGFHFSFGMTGSITVSGGGGNVAPVVTNPGPQSGQEEQLFEVTVFASDGNGDPLTMDDNGTTPAWASFLDNGNNSATITGTPGLGDAAIYNQSVRASDGSLVDLESFTITIDPAPVTLVTLNSGGFSPVNAIIQVGESIRWVKDVGGNHWTTNGTGVADPNAGTIWDAELRASSPEFEFQFNTPGSYPYFCRNHETTETGSVTVEDTTVVGIRDLPAFRGRFLAPHPNPFAATVTLAFELDDAARVRIDIFDLEGRMIRNFLAGEFAAGPHAYRWDGRDDYGRIRPNGIYFARLLVDGAEEVRKVFKTR
jgi:plastocyanin